MHVEESEYNNFCMKLMRNLGYFSEEKQIYAPTVDRCNILKNWIYNSINKEKITVDVINKCYTVYTEHMSRRGNNKICHIDVYDDIYKERIYATLLHIFETKVSIIRDKLNGHDEESKIPCKKFVCDCLKIYKYMNVSYCPNEGYNREEHKDTCLKLSQFKSSYNLLRDSIDSKKHKIPSLDEKDNECFENKPPAQLNTLLTLTDHPVPSYVLGDGLDGPTGQKFSTPLENKDNSLQKNITTTIGTVSGASSLLALLYKFNTKHHLNIKSIIYSCSYKIFTYYIIKIILHNLLFFY
ncbi:hypothetical protein PVNG_03812 [Plasmodium vivax North Korean]|uniref:Variable surface protein n=1 Tax=Plasmodium vivax North Korean TaxID=1035514 RepID=A0A0J9WDB4_PLAVI|nr:hypothetical protein PVNG_03812 [Plasmodium vivax North Korean]